MVLKGISNSEHSKMLWEITNLAYEEAKALEKELNEIYSKYNQQLHGLSQAVEVYEALVTRIKIKLVVKKIDIITEWV